MTENLRKQEIFKQIADHEISISEGFRLLIELRDSSKQEQWEKTGLLGTAGTMVELVEKTGDYLKEVLGKILKLSPQQIEPGACFEEYGIDSVMVNMFNARVEAELCPIPKTLLFEFQTLEQLARYFIEHHQSRLIDFFQLEEPVLVEVEEEVDHREIEVQGTPGTLEAGEIAIIGISGRYPCARNLEEFWENLKSGRDCISEIPVSRWDISKYNDEELYCRWGGFLEDVDMFDPLFFNISPGDARYMDPQERLFLETVWALLEDAGYSREAMRKSAQREIGGEVGVFVGVTSYTYHLLGPGETHHTPTPSSIANRVSFIFNFHGPSLVVDTACSSSLVALHMACESIKKGECQVAVAGGVNVYLHPCKYIEMCSTGMLSPKGRCHTFGEGADGFVPGEGVGAVLLKPLSSATADNDHIYAVIKGSAVNHGGRTNGYTVPNPNAQAVLIEKALTNAQIHPRTISCIEAHGTGTSLGDPIEIAGLNKAYKRYTQETHYCSIGSVKTNIGHLESAAGIAGLTRVVLQFKHKQLVPSLHAKQLNPKIDFVHSPVYIQQELTGWKPPVIQEEGEEIVYPRRAAVSSFGAGGANAHVILEEWSEEDSQGQQENTGQGQVTGDGKHDTPYLLVLSAKNEERLKVYAKEIKDFLAVTSHRLEDIAYTLAVGREAMNQRIVLRVSGIAAAVEKLNQYCQGVPDIEHVYTGSKKAGQAKSSLFIEGKEGEEYTRSIIRGGKLDKIALLWVSGVEIDWDLLYCAAGGVWHSCAARRISLPTYPFARERYWKPGADNALGRPRHRNFKMHDLSMTPFKLQARSGTSAAPPGLHLFNRTGEALRYYQGIWEKSPLAGPIQGPGGDQKQPLLVFSITSDFPDALHRQLKQHTPVTLIKAGPLFKETGSSRFEIHPGHPEDYGQLVETLVKQGQAPVNIVFLWHQENAAHDDEGDNLQSILEQGVFSLLYLTQALMAQKTGKRIKLLYVYPGWGDNVKCSPAVYAAHAAFSGFARTLYQENPRFEYKTVELANPGSEFPISWQWPRLSEVIITELALDDHQVEIRYIGDKEGNHRYVRRLQAVAPKPGPTSAELLRKHSVYLVTGGMGGLGRIFARYLAQQFKARLVLVGRSPLDPEKKSWTRELQSLGAEVMAVQADVSKRQEVEHLVNQVKKRFNTIHGIIHSAGVTRDSFIIKKMPEEIEAVLAPKVLGTIWLDEATREEPLDFFVVFSSLAAVIGNVGQCDYAYGNRFMDEYIRRREELRQAGKRKGRSISINWPLWEEGGMKIAKQHLTQLAEQSGMKPLPTPAGLKAWETAIISGNAQCIVIYGSPHSTGFLKRFVPLSVPTVPSRLKEKTTAFLRDIFGEILYISPGKIDIHTNFKEYGIDSITIQRFNAKMTQHLENLSRTLLFECQTLDEVVDYIVRNHETQLTVLFGLQGETAAKVDETGKPGTHDQQWEELQWKNQADMLPGGIIPGARDGGEPDIAIIGLSGRYPGAKDLNQFWENLKAGKDCITEIPASRWDYRRYYDPDPEKAASGKIYCKWGGFLEDEDRFDPLFFNISPKDAETMDPQERLFLETAWTALEDSGNTREGLGDIQVGVFAGVTTYSYLLLGPEQWNRGNMVIPNTSPWSIANRVSYVFNFHGPSIPVDTACSSSLTALHLACESLKKGECHMAVVGGVNLYLHPSKYIAMCQMRMLSPTGRCQTFGAGSNGFVPGEGVGAVVLKPLPNAVKANDHIYAVIKGSAVNHGGSTSGYTVPNPRAQSRLICSALEKAGTDARAIGYIEAHGTGTILGDPVEITGLTNAFRKFTRDKKFCAIGSVKSNIGHLESAAGISGLTRVIMQLKHRQMVPSLHCSRLNPNIDFENSPFYVQRELAEWKQPYPRRAGLSSFGAGGANAHVILEEAPQMASKPQYSPPDAVPHLIVLSARTKDKLKTYAEKLHLFLETRSYAPGSLARQNQQSLRVKSTNEGAPGIISCLQEDLLRMASRVLTVSENDIDPEEDLEGYGFDPVKLAALANGINQTYTPGEPVTPGVFTGVASLASLSRYLVDRFKETFKAYYRQDAPNREPGGKSAEAEEKEQVNLANIAFTLQMGREPLEWRLAVMVSSVETLKEKLSQFCQGKEDIEKLYQGNVKTNREKPGLISGRAGEEYIRVVMEDRDLDQAAQLWISGVTIDWKRLFPGSLPNRISLPTYPFAGKRYWIPQVGENTGDTAPASEISRLHPLLGANTSTLMEQRFTTRLTGKEFYLQDHMVAGQEVLPGAAYLEMARAAGELAAESPVRKIKHIIWARPIAVNHPLDVHLRLYPGKDHVDYEVNTVEPGSEPLVHSRGKLVYQGDSHEHSPGKIDMPAIKNRCKYLIDAAVCYDRYRKGGLVYGPCFQALGQVYRDEKGTEILAYLHLPQACQAESRAFGLHPALMDGALQSLIGFETAAGETSGGPYLPFSLGEVEILKPLAENCWVYAVPVGEPQPDPGMKRFHIQLVNETGQVLVKLTDYAVRSLQTETASSGKPFTHRYKECAVDEKIYFYSEWEEAALELKSTTGSDLTGIPGPLLLFDYDEQVYQELNRLIRPAPVILVKPGKGYRESDPDRHVFEIAPGSWQDYLQLVKTLKQQDLLPHRILHLWSQENFTGKKDEVARQLERGIYSLFYLTRALVARKLKEKVQLLYVYLVHGDQEQPLYGAVSGFARTVRVEHPVCDSRTIGLLPPPGEGGPLLSAYMAELLKEFQYEAGEECMEVRYQGKGKQRFVKRFKEFHPGNRIQPPLPWREKGVYIITGGTGALGLIIAQYLAQKVNARLVLTDVTEPDTRKQEKIEELEKTGAQVMFTRADISRMQDAERLVKKARSAFKEIHGVIHCAGIIRDALLVNKTKEDMTAVLGPKVYGTVWLDLALKDEPLDLFVLFSSTAGLLGNPGQGDYAYANRFMDDFARARKLWRSRGERQGKTLSINWSLWKDGGMRIDDQTQEWMKKRAGSVALETTDGLEAFEKTLGAPQTQLAVVKGNRTKLLELLGIPPASDPVESIQPQPNEHKHLNLPLPVSKDQWREKVEKDLVRLCVQLLKVEESEVNIEDPLSDYGLDSIMMMSMLNRLEAMYKRVVEPHILAEYNTIQRLAAYLIDSGIAVPGFNTGERSLRRAGGSFEKPPPAPPQNFLLESGVQRDFTSRFSRPRVKPENKIAVVGMACRFPQSNSPETFWANLANGRDLVTEVPPDRWDTAEFFNPDKNASNKSYSKWGAFINNIYYFDAEFFGIRDENALVMDPYQRILLELAEELFCRSGFDREKLSGSRTGVYIGGGESTYADKYMSKLQAEAMKHLVVSNIPNMMAARISDFYNLKGVSQTIDTACSSALVALHQACQAIRSGECDMALAGGIELILDHHIHVGFSKAEVLSDDGTAYVFDQRAKGFALGEGAGIVLLKSYETALEEGDEILAVIAGSAVNNDGRTMGVTVPSIEGQKGVIRQALAASEVPADTITYMEAHGTGTLLGDPIEIRAATQVYREFTSNKQYCAVGSVKSNMGHLLRAAGIPSFIKVVLALQHKFLPPTIHCESPHPRFRFADSPFYPVTTAGEWLPGKNNPIRRAAVSSFGFGGTNCHMILEEFIPVQGYMKKRQPLPLPRFKRKQYCPGLEILEERGTPGTGDVNEAFLMEVLEGIQQGNISPQEAVHLV
jgi:acyl transferase domain-containing protein/NAD(P)-dependent dehydrogenase (short-subunit alcohol dehydrogenase family)/acyl carrier protein